MSQSPADKLKALIAEGEARVKREREERDQKRASLGLSNNVETGKPEPEVPLIDARGSGFDVPQKLLASLTDEEAEDFDFGAVIEEQREKQFEKYRLGGSRIGGLPDLPPTVDWPELDGLKIPFIAQIDLAEFLADKKTLLPQSGHLYLFALIDNEPQHQPAPFRLFIDQTPAKSLIRQSIPKDIWQDWQHSSIYHFIPVSSKGARGTKNKSEAGWLFGTVYEYCQSPGEVADHALRDGGDWILLFSIKSDRGNMSFGDCGRLNVVIRRSDLERQFFEAAICLADGAT